MLRPITRCRFTQTVSYTRRYRAASMLRRAAAKKNKCDAIVMASHGRRGVTALLLGSETQKVLTHSKLPVIVVR